MWRERGGIAIHVTALVTPNLVYCSVLKRQAKKVIQGDQKVCVYRMITVKKHTKIF
jgi:hypothetical protein